MSTLYEFVQQEVKSLDLPSASAISPTGQLALANTFSVDLVKAQVAEAQAKKFAVKMVELAASEGFLKELSAEIPGPAADESEDAFVARSKAAVMKLLDRHLK